MMRFLEIRSTAQTIPNTEDKAIPQKVNRNVFPQAAAEIGDRVNDCLKIKGHTFTSFRY